MKDSELLLREVSFELLGKLNDTYESDSEYAAGQRFAYLKSILIIKKKLSETRNNNAKTPN
tara:strand:+ start:54206 stop:54388 length:183 start_codon:yes stop_codon:yes gene_type:complete